MSLVVVRHGACVFVTLQGAHHNAIDQATWVALRDTFEPLESDEALRCVVISGAAGHFAAGADITEFPALRASLAGVRHYHEDIIAPALDAIRHSAAPVIAKISGDCIGGGLEIAASCDLRYAADNARFGAPIGRLGFSMAPEELAALLRVASPAVCAELLFEGRLLDGAEAAARGLVTRVVKAELLDVAVDEAIRRIVTQAPRAQRINKVLLRTLTAAALDEAQRLFAFSYAETSDHQEGVTAFLERREPHFTNN